MISTAGGKRVSKESSTQSLSSTYWDLHRNTLLFSSLLLIICIPGAKPSANQSFLWLSFTGVAFNSLRLIVACAATYAFFAYVLEWANEALAMLRKENKLAASAIAHLDSFIESYNSRLSGCLNRLEQVTKMALREMPSTYAIGSEQRDLALRELSSKSYEAVIADSGRFAFQSPASILPRAMLSPNPPDVHRLIATTEGMIKNYSLEVGFHAAEVASRNEAVLMEKAISDLASSTDNALQALNDLRVEARGFRAVRLRMGYAVFLWRSQSFIRLVILGLLIPSTVYVTAVAHLGGALNFAHFPSLFSLLPEAPKAKPS